MSCPKVVKDLKIIEIIIFHFSTFVKQFCRSFVFNKVLSNFEVMIFTTEHKIYMIEANF